MSRLEVDWTPVAILTDESLMDLFGRFVKQLTGLTVEEHRDGRMLIFTDQHRILRHAVYNVGDNDWGCFCDKALVGECAATTFARVRFMMDLEEHG